MERVVNGLKYSQGKAYI